MKKTLIVSILLLTVCQLAFAEKFTIPVLPDTQCEVNNKPAMFTSQMEWIVKNKSALNIPIVLHVGDVVDWDTPDHRMWNVASAGFKLLDEAKIPYAIAVGNHDTGAVKVGGGAAPGDVHANVRITTEFNTFFPASRFAAQQGSFEAGKSDNCWHSFRAGDRNWLVLCLELWARQSAVDWAKTVVASHPNDNVIVVTHSHLESKGAIKQDKGGYGDLSPQEIFTQFLSRYPNVLLVLSGHVGSSAKRTDQGVNGNTIYQILQDYQGADLGGGYIRLLEFDTTAGTIAAKMYSPFYDLAKTDASQFLFSDVHFVAPGKLGEAKQGK